MEGTHLLKVAHLGIRFKKKKKFMYTFQVVLLTKINIKINMGK